eukprot:5424831-Amphidinium_carterae.2
MSSDVKVELGSPSAKRARFNRSLSMSSANTVIDVDLADDVVDDQPLKLQGSETLTQAAEAFLLEEGTKQQVDDVDVETMNAWDQKMNLSDADLAS